MYGGGLDRYDRPTNTFTHYRHDENAPHSLSENTAYALAQDPDGTLWVGTYGGLNHFDPQAGNFTRYLDDPADPLSLSGNLVAELRVDRDGNVWVGTDKSLRRWRLAMMMRSARQSSANATLP